MQKIFTKYKKRVLDLLTDVEHYFLAEQKPDDILENRKENIILRGIKIPQNSSLFFDDDQLQLNLSISNMENTVSVAVFMPTILFESIVIRVGGCCVFYLFPQYLEMVFVMLQKMQSYVAGDLFILLINLSFLPCEKELKSHGFIKQYSDLHGEILMNFFEKIKRFQTDNKIRLLIIEQKNILGIKNSAFLERIF
jgi:hypothetical protein